MFSTTEITSNEDASDNVIHQRLFYAYVEAAKLISGNILELGCGVGRGLEVILKKSEQYTAIDKNTNLLNLLSETYPNCKFLDMFMPPFEGISDNQFDYVITFQVIEHIEDDNLFLKEIHRVLKPGGKAIITTPNIQMSLTRNPWHIREYTASELDDLLNKYFKKVSVQGVCGNQKIMDYFEKNKTSVEKITRFDILNLQHRLPRRLLQVPYDILNRMNRKKLMDKNDDLVMDVSVDDYFLSSADKGFDLFCIVEK